MQLIAVVCLYVTADRQHLDSKCKKHYALCTDLKAGTLRERLTACILEDKKTGGFVDTMM